MLWFNKKVKKQELAEKAKESVKQVALHKEKQRKTVAQAQKIADNFNQALIENGVTIRIHAAMGGKRH